MQSSVATGEARKGHPRGLYLLFLTEMWERMSYYGMRGLLVLFLTDKVRGGFGWSTADALSLYGTYTGLVYLTPIVGGYIADRYIGQRKAVLLGDYLRGQAPDIAYAVPALHHRPARAMEQVLACCAVHDPADLLLVGSSLGGFYATVAAERPSPRCGLSLLTTGSGCAGDGVELSAVVNGMARPI